MLINHDHQVIFVHIPKNAGSSIRGELEASYRQDSIFSPGFIDVQGITYDKTHLTLAQLVCLFPDTYLMFKTYSSYAILRCPYQRFCSCISQYAKMSKGRMLVEYSKSDIRLLIAEVIGKLESNVIDHELVYFNTQCSYVFHNGEAIVKNLYRLSDIGRLFSDLNLEYSGTKKNTSVIFDSKILNLMARFSLFVKRKYNFNIPPQLVKNKIRTNITTPGNYSDIIEYAEEFIENYYREDIELWNSSYD